MSYIQRGKLPTFINSTSTYTNAYIQLQNKILSFYVILCPCLCIVIHLCNPTFPYHTTPCTTKSRRRRQWTSDMLLPLAAAADFLFFVSHISRRTRRQLAATSSKMFTSWGLPTAAAGYRFLAAGDNIASNSSTLPDNIASNSSTLPTPSIYFHGYCKLLGCDTIRRAGLTYFLIYILAQAPKHIMSLRIVYNLEDL